MHKPNTLTLEDCREALYNSKGMPTEHYTDTIIDTHRAGFDELLSPNQIELAERILRLQTVTARLYTRSKGLKRHNGGLQRAVARRNKHVKELQEIIFRALGKGNLKEIMSKHITDQMTISKGIYNELSSLQALAMHAQSVLENETALQQISLRLAKLLEDMKI